VESFLRTTTSGTKNVFLTESQLRAEMKAGRRPRGPTPDVLFLRPVRIKRRSVTWIDAKLYYASALFANNKRIPSGKLRDMAKCFNQHYGGEGAFVFGHGFCADLKSIVTNALSLDSTPLDMTAVNDFQDAN